MKKSINFVGLILCTVTAALALEESLDSNYKVVCKTIVPLETSGTSNTISPEFSYQVSNNKLFIFHKNGDLWHVLTRRQVNDYLSTLLSPYDDIRFVTLPYHRQHERIRPQILDLQQWLNQVCEYSFEPEKKNSRKLMRQNSINEYKSSRQTPVSNLDPDLETFIQIMSSPSTLFSKRPFKQ